MIVGVFAMTAVFGVIALTLLLIFRKDLVGVDVSARSLLRLYLYIASLAGLLVFVIGIASLLDWAAGAAFGVQAVYGRAPSVWPSFMDYSNFADQSAMRHDDALLQGLTLTVFGALFWGGHAFARRSLGPDERSSVLRRAYNVLCTFVFGVGTVVMLPVGIYQLLSYVLVTPAADVFKSGFGDSLAGGIASVPVWLVYLTRVVRAAPREARMPIPHRTAPVPNGIA